MKLKPLFLLFFWNLCFKGRFSDVKVYLPFKIKKTQSNHFITFFKICSVIDKSIILHINYFSTYLRKLDLPMYL